MSKYIRKNISSEVGFTFAETADLDLLSIGYSCLKSAYRLDMDTHGTCKKNCRANPKCLAGLGEKYWFDKEEDEDEDEAELDLQRSDGIPAGLRNLGNTCYVNSFLQIWFHNSKFRQALYEWDPGEDPEEQDNQSILDPNSYEPRSKVASLQALFAMMQYTKRRYIDPTDFICKLGLNPSVQQDAQEFSKLFVSLLEKSLAHQSSINISSMIQKQFRGEYAYVTKCLTCNRESVSPSFFYELDLALAAGNKNLSIQKCLEDFLRVEKMTGDEKYFCEGCQSKQEATRCCKLKALPPVLNLQLNRFQYDMQIGRKKKLNSCIMYPDELDMSSHMEGLTKESCCYQLTGVLMHVGPDANHGHYIAHIQELETGNWFKFSDENVVPIKFMSGSSSEKGVKRPKAVDQSSNTAYMLVYLLKSSISEIRRNEKVEIVKRDSVRRTALLKRRLKAEASIKEAAESSARDGSGRKRKASSDSSDSIEEIDYSGEYSYSNCRVFPVNLQPHLRNKIDKDNLEFDEETKEKNRKRLEVIRNNNKKKQKMRENYKGLLPKPEGDESSEAENLFEFVPKNWLMSWLADPHSVGPIETKHYLCVHGNIDIDYLADLKACLRGGVDQLYREYAHGEGPRLTEEKLCLHCVENKARLISLDFRLLRDQEFIKHQLKVPTDGKGFWVGKRSLNNWRRLARISLEDKIIREAQEFSEKEEGHVEEGHVSMHSGDSNPEQNRNLSQTLNLSGLKAKLERMGTNVSVSQGHGLANNKSSSEGSAGISVIRNGESFKMANIAEVKLNFDDSARLALAKPSCAVKPLVKSPVQSKPSATVRPLNIQEDLLRESSKPEDPAQGGEDETSGGSVAAEGSDVTHSADKEEDGNKNLHISPKKIHHLSEDKQHSLRNCETEVVSNGDQANSKTKNTESCSYVSSNTNRVGEESHEYFNADIVCPHGNLRIEERCKQLISRDVWFKLCSYFHNHKTFQFGIKSCVECREDESRAFVQREKWREEATRQKSKLPDLFTNIERPKWSKPTTKRVYLLSSDFVLAWRGFVRGLHPGKSDLLESITDVNNSILLCPHGGLLYVPHINWENEPDPNIVMIKEEEWANVQEMFNVDAEIRVDRENTAAGPILTASPPLCQKCVKNKVEAEQESRLNYKDQVLYVTFLTQDEEMPNGDNYVQECPASAENGLKISGGYNMRRSARRKKGRGEREFVVSSDTLLRDLKVQIMEVFKVAPYDQILFLDGEYLRDNSQSLGSLGVLPGSAIFLKADHSIPCPPEDWTNPHPEQGFKGTGLLSG